MRIISLLILIIVSINIFSVASFSEKIDISEIESIKCSSYILIDEKSGQILAQKNIDEKLYPASTTKIMTAILALEYGDLNRKLVASVHAVNDIGKDGMNIGIVAGEEMNLEDLLNALLVRSANETANIIAENLAPSLSDFVALMNKRAKELGCTNTNFVNPCGKDSDSLDKGHLSTASDLAKLARHAMTFPKFREIVKKRITTIQPTNKMEQKRYLGSTNKLLRPSYKSPYYTEITGIKTGFTSKAGQNLVSSAIDKNGNELISVILGVHEDNVFSASKELFEYGFKNFATKDIIKQNDVVKTIPLAYAEDKNIELISGGTLSSIYPIDNSSIKWYVTANENLNPSLVPPIKKGDTIGNIEYFVNGTSVGIVPAISNADVPKTLWYSISSSFKSITVKSIIIVILKLGIILMLLLLIILFALRFSTPYLKKYIK